VFALNVRHGLLRRLERRHSFVEVGVRDRRLLLDLDVARVELHLERFGLALIGLGDLTLSVRSAACAHTYARMRAHLLVGDHALERATRLGALGGERAVLGRKLGLQARHVGLRLLELLQTNCAHRQ
jgi:hypothetical protein